MLNNFWNNGLSELYAINEEDGVIVTGDGGVGIMARNWVGAYAKVVNEGSITVGDGRIGDRLYVGFGLYRAKPV